MSTCLKSRSRRSVAACVAAAALLTCTVYAANKIVIKNLPQEDFLPGVDAMGNIDALNEFDAEVTQIISLKTGKFRVKASGEVENESGVKQTYKNSADVHAAVGITESPDLQINKSLYKVGATGKAKLSISGVVNVDAI